MEPTLSWLDLTTNDRDKMRRVLDLFNEKGTVDDMGLGTLRDALSDALFPGTSTVQTRLRYALFIPWVYQRLEPSIRRGGRGFDLSRRARDAELALIEPLAVNEEEVGVIGRESGVKLKQLPSQVYWGMLSRWGVLNRRCGQSQLHGSYADWLSEWSGHSRADDPGISQERRLIWHPRLPHAPQGFPDSLSFQLSRDEAEFFRAQIKAKCENSLLAWFVDHSEEAQKGAQYAWDVPLSPGAPVKLRQLVKWAERFSLHVEGAGWFYRYLLAERRHEISRNDDQADFIEDDESLAEGFRNKLCAWAANERAKGEFDSHGFWALMDEMGCRVSVQQKRFVNEWSTKLLEVDPGDIAESADLADLIKGREIDLKKERARLGADTARLLNWSGADGVGRMDLRWRQVKRLLNDLHQGLAS